MHHLALGSSAERLKVATVNFPVVVKDRNAKSGVERTNLFFFSSLNNVDVIMTCMHVWAPVGVCTTFVCDRGHRNPGAGLLQTVVSQLM